MSAAAFKIAGGNYEQGGRASRNVKEMLKRVGADPAVVRRAMIAAYEAEMNVVIHAHGGELRASLENGQLDVEVTDEGPGIADIDQAMREGFSTAGPQARELGFGAGMGLPNIKKSSDRFSIDSGLGRGTRIAFTIFLKPQALYGAGRHSLAIDANKCRQSLHCLRVCPTQALRVFRGKPEVLDYLCVDCAACVGACPSGALAAQSTLDRLVPAADTVLIVTPESLVQFGADAGPQKVLAALDGLGFAGVQTTAPWEAALRAAVIEYAANEAPRRPVISPACPAIVNLIETRFPSLLPQVAPLLPAMAALRANLAVRRTVFVTSCLCQRTLLSASDGASQAAVVLPAVLRALVAPRIERDAATTAPAAPAGPRTPSDQYVLRVTGLRHVVRVLDAIEDGLAHDLRVVEPWACDQGCFGSPLLTEDAYLARRRWEAAGMATEIQPEVRAVRRSQPYVPRQGLRLDNDMAKAIQKLGRIDKLRRSLPGSDCGMCGAPTCAALAEDIVLGRAQPHACVRQEQAQPHGGANGRSNEATEPRSHAEQEEGR